MSGVAGGIRIKKANVKNTFKKYQQEVLSKIPGYQSSRLTGSVKVGANSDYGDLDIVVDFDADDKKEVKQRIIDFVNKASDSVMVPFQSEKYQGRKYYNAGELISVLYPIHGSEGNIQIDNIISLSPEESDYKERFLDISAAVQGLLVGLAKVILLEENPAKIFKKLGIRKVSKLQDGQEYEFNLSSSKLTLRIADVKDFKTVDHKDVWSTTDWNVVRKLFDGYNVDGTFDELLNSMNKGLKNPRSRRRVPGLFKTMVTIKTGEVGTPKAQMKQDAIDKTNKTFSVNFLEHYFFESDKYNGDVVGLYGGGFKPPHKGHYSILERLVDEVDKVIIFVGHKPRDGESINAEQSKKIWEAYAEHIDKPVEVVLSKVTPIKDIYDWVDENQDKVRKVVVGGTEEDAKKFNYFEKNKDKYKKVEVKSYDLLKTGKDEKLSASNIRNNVKYLRSMKWTPDDLSKKEKDKILTIIRSKK